MAEFKSSFMGGYKKKAVDAYMLILKNLKTKTKSCYVKRSIKEISKFRKSGITKTHSTSEWVNFNI